MILINFVALFDKFPDIFGSEVDDLHSTDDGESSEESHVATYCWYLVHKLYSSIFCDSVKSWGVEVDSHKS